MKDIKEYRVNRMDNGIILHANESCFPISEKVKYKFKEAIEHIEFQRYPEIDAFSLREAYAKKYNLTSNEVLCGNGSDEMLGILINTNIWKDNKVLTLSLDFSMYDYFVSFNEGVMVKYPVEKDGSFDLTKFIELGKKEKVNMIMFSNPNNPTGHTLTNEEIKVLLEAFQDIPVVIDEAYGDFADETMIDEINNYDNLFVTRTMSKAYSLAGARVGFLLSNAKNIKELSAYKEPYTVNVLSTQLALLQLEEDEAIQKQIEMIKKLRKQLFLDLNKIKNDDLWINESNANFIYGKTNCKDKLFEALEKNEILIRNYQDDSFRITVGNKEENQEVVRVFESVFGKEG